MAAKDFVLKWGIASCGKISSDFVNALRLLPHKLNKVTTVAARNQEDAQAFANKWSIPVAYGSYEELAKSADVDIVYIGSIHPQHKVLCSLFLNAGKHVLCEKPLAMNAKEVREIVQLAKSKGLFLMEGFWCRFFPVYDHLRRELAAGTIGDPMVTTAMFGFNLQWAERMRVKDLGGGATLDVGCYTLQFVQLIFKDKPVSIKCSGVLTPDGVDNAMTAVLTYPGGQVATVVCSSACTLNNVATVSGSKGLIKIVNVWSPETIEVCGKTTEYIIPKSDIPMVFDRSEGFQYEADAVRECIAKGMKEHPFMTWDESITIAEVSDEIRRQLGVQYPQDK